MRYLPHATLLLMSLLSAESAFAQSPLEESLRHRLEAGLTSTSLEVMDEGIYARQTLRQFYAGRAYALLWVDEAGWTKRGRSLREWLDSVPDRHGLNAGDYHLRVIEDLADTERTAALVDIELALSDAFVTLASHFLAGRLNPESLSPEWVANRRAIDLTPILEQVDVSAAPGDLLEALLPRYEAYHHLVERLAELRALRQQGGWPAVEPGPALRLEASGPRVAQLTRRLALGGDLEPAAVGEAFDAGVEAAVLRFQTRHGLDGDGVVGPATLRALNVSVAARIDQLLVNLERWRWLPESLGRRHVLVNIADYRLDLVEDGAIALSMRVIVGTQYRRTPVFSDRIRYLVLNPSWEVPPRIARQDKLPLLKAEPDYLASQGYSLLQGWGAEERRVDPATVDWASIPARSFPYRLRQGPGPLNALGQIKFMFPNRFNVYLHDTPARELFDRNTRAFSSGCIRLQTPLDLAAHLLRDNPAWSRESLEGAAGDGVERTVRLSEPVPVHLLYWTAWSDAEGTIHFRDDIYDRDAPVLNALRAAPPARLAPME